MPLVICNQRFVQPPPCKRPLEPFVLLAAQIGSCTLHLTCVPYQDFFERVSFHQLKTVSNFDVGSDTVGDGSKKGVWEEPPDGCSTRAPFSTVPPSKPKSKRRLVPAPNKACAPWSWWTSSSHGRNHPRVAVSRACADEKDQSNWQQQRPPAVQRPWCRQPQHRGLGSRILRAQTRTVTLGPRAPRRWRVTESASLSLSWWMFPGSLCPNFQFPKACGVARSLLAETFRCGPGHECERLHPRCLTMSPYYHQMRSLVAQASPTLSPRNGGACTVHGMPTNGVTTVCTKKTAVTLSYGLKSRAHLH